MQFFSVKDLIEEAEKRSVPISAVVKEMEAENQEISLLEVEQRMFKQWLVMKEAAKIGLTNPKNPWEGL